MSTEYLSYENVNFEIKKGGVPMLIKEHPGIENVTQCKIKDCS